MDAFTRPRSFDNILTALRERERQLLNEIVDRRAELEELQQRIHVLEKPEEITVAGKRYRLVEEAVG